MALNYENQKRVTDQLSNYLMNNTQNEFSLEGDKLILRKPLHTNVNYLPEGWKFDEEKGTFIYADQENIFELKLERMKLDNIQTQVDIVHELYRTNDDLKIVKTGEGFEINKTIEELDWENLRQQGFVFDENKGLYNPNIMAGGQALSIKLKVNTMMTTKSGEEVTAMEGKDKDNFTSTVRDDVSADGSAEKGSKGLEDGKDFNDINITNGLNSKQDLRENLEKYYIDVDQNNKPVAVERTTGKIIDDEAIIKKVQLAEHLIRTYYAMQGEEDYNRKILNEAELKAVFDSNVVVPKIFSSICMAVEDAFKRGLPPSVENIAEATAEIVGGYKPALKEEIMRIVTPMAKDFNTLERTPSGKEEKRKQIVKIVAQGMGINENDAMNYLQRAQEEQKEREDEKDNELVMERKMYNNGNGDFIG